MKRWLFILLAVLPLMSPGLIMVAVNAVENPSGELWRDSRPSDKRRPDRCNWYCHNRGCPHELGLPWPEAAESLYRGTIRGLRAAGGGDFAGYQAANLVILAFGWPLGMYLLVLLGLWQRSRIVELKRQLRREREYGG